MCHVLVSTLDMTEENLEGQVYAFSGQYWEMSFSKTREKPRMRKALDRADRDTQERGTEHAQEGGARGAQAAAVQ